MRMKPLFETTAKRFTTIDNANVVLLYDTLNLFFSVVLGKVTGMLSTLDGRPSAQVYSAFQRIRGHCKKYTKPGQRVALVFAWDNQPKAKQEIFPEYKMNRDANQKLDEADLSFRMGTFQEMLRALPCTFIEAPEEEADDVIATLVASYRKPTYIMSSDKDLWSLLQNSRVKIVSLRESAVVTDLDLKEKYALPNRKNAYKVALYKAVMGDVSDNVPKVPRIPSKAFHEALNDISYSREDDCVSLLIERASRLEKPRAHTLLVEHEALVRRNLLIVTLKEKVDLCAQYNEGAKERLEAIFDDFECRSITGEGRHEFLYR